MHTIASDRIDVNTQAAERDFRLSSLTTNDALLIVRSQFNSRLNCRGSVWCTSSYGRSTPYCGFSSRDR